MFVVSMRVDVGRRPGIVFAECERCAAAFDAWMWGSNYATGLEDEEYRPEAFDRTDAAAAEWADAWLEAFRAWRRTMQVEGCDHLQVLR